MRQAGDMQRRFDNYVSIYVVFAVGCLECVGLHHDSNMHHSGDEAQMFDPGIWTRQGQTWEHFKSLCVDHTGRHLGRLYEVAWVESPFLYTEDGA